MAGKARFRLKFWFWLDITKPIEHELAKEIEILRRERKFASAVRDGIRLVRDLRAGRTDVLFSLFPWVREAAQQPENNTTALEAQLARLELLMTTQTAQPIAASSEKFPSAGPTAMNVPQFALPAFEDDDLEDTVIIKRDTSTASAKNFLNSLMN